MAERPRKFWQLHLSTALAAMLLASVLLGFNLVERDIRDEYQAWYLKDFAAIKTWGWPFRFGEVRTFKGRMPWPNPTNRETDDLDEHGRDQVVDYENNLGRVAVENLLVCAGLTLAFAALCEFSIRLELQRRAGRQQPQGELV